MQQKATDNLNRIEIRHRDAIVDAGLKPEDFLFRAQLTEWRKAGFWRSGDELQFMHNIATWAPSRFELIELIPLYYYADRHIRMMQHLSADRFAYPAVNFAIATDPRQLVTASASSRRKRTVVDPRVVSSAGGDSEVVPETVEDESIVWMHAGLMNILKLLVTHLTSTLVAPEENLPRFLQSVSESEDPRDLLEHLFRYRPSLSGRAEGNRPLQLQKAEAILLIASVTFVAGHEVGHIYLGHTDVRDRLNPFTSLPEGMPPHRADEMAADAVGLTAIWDGMSQGQEGVSIDYTWIAPVLFLAFKSGWAASVADEDDPASVEHFTDWAARLQVLIRTLLLNLRRNGFEAHRTETVQRSAPLLAGAVHEWVRLGGLIGEGIDFDPTVYLTVKAVCDSLPKLA